MAKQASLEHPYPSSADSQFHLPAQFLPRSLQSAPGRVTLEIPFNSSMWLKGPPVRAKPLGIKRAKAGRVAWAMEHFRAPSTPTKQVCKRMDLVCQRMLNQGFLKVERYHNLCQKQVKAQLPRRESERRNHSLARHADILAAVETRLSLLNMTFMKYVDSNLCCFIPGKVIDEIYRVLRYVNSTRAPQRAHEVLQELRDISSMAMEYFDEKIVPILKRKIPGSDVSGRLIGTAPVPGPSAALTTMQLFSKQNPSRQEVTKLQQQVKANGTGLTALKREISELRIKVQEQQKQLQDQDQKLLEQTQIIGEQNARLAELERKLREVMESTVGNSSGSGSNEQSPRKRRKAVESTDCPRKSKRLRNRK
nr:PREDICTED: F-box only protein 28 [Opisthocomus hoazin]